MSKGLLLASASMLWVLALNDARAQDRAPDPGATAPPPAGSAASPNPPVDAVQPGPPEATPSTASPGGTGTKPEATGLSEVVVTAQRRSENLQKAAVSVNALSQVQLVANGITDPTLLSRQVPGLLVPPSGGGAVNYFIRGTGNFVQEPFSDPAIAFNQDNIYIARPFATGGPFYDLERVEVLKGPQGTLYGRNATGGAINVIPEKPSLNHTGGYVSASYGNYSAYDVEGAFNAPIGDRSALRISATALGHDGYLSDGSSDQNTKALRLQFLTKPTNKLSIRISGDYADLSGVGVGANYYDSYAFNPVLGRYVVRPGQSANIGTYDPRGLAYFQGLTAQPAARSFITNLPRGFLNTKLYGTNTEVNYDTPYGRATLILGWRPTRVAAGYAALGTPAQTQESDEQYSSEFRFQGNRIGIFDYSLGALYFHEREKGAFIISQYTLAAFQNYSQRLDSYSGFGRITAHLTDTLRLVGGIRYTSDNKTFNGNATSLVVVCTRQTPFGPSCPTAPLLNFDTTPAGAGLPVPAVSGSVLPLFGPTGFTGAVIARSDTNIPQSNLSNNRPTYRAAIEYDLFRNSLLYFSYETGFRTGGFNFASGYGTYAPETIQAYTFGSKNRFFDQRLELNLELFRWKYENQQVAHIGVDLAGQTNNFTQNVGRSTNQGAEVETRFLLTPTTVLNANVQYLDATYDQFSYQLPLQGFPPYTGCRVTPASAALVNVNCSGKPSFNAPKYTLNLGAEQTFELRGYKLTGLIDTQYQTSRFVGFDYQPAELAPSQWTSNAQLSISPDQGKWTAALFIRNIEDRRYLLQTANFTAGSYLAAVTSPPRTYGVRVSLKY